VTFRDKVVLIFFSFSSSPRGCRKSSRERLHFFQHKTSPNSQILSQVSTRRLVVFFVGSELGVSSIYSGGGDHVGGVARMINGCLSLE